MTWSLRLTHGDFATEGAKIATVTGESKLLQDLRCHLLEPLGTDNLHSTYGSSIEDIIGESNLDLAILEIEVEIHRIIQEHQDQQLARAKEDRFTYGRPTLNPGEVILDLTGIEIAQQQDKLNIKVTIQVGTEQEITVDVPVDIDPNTLAATGN